MGTAIAYAYQSPESKLMQVKPRHPKKEKMVNFAVLSYSYAYIGMLQMFFCWLMFFYASPKIMYLMQNDIGPEDYSKKDEISDRQGMSVYYWTLVLGQIGAA